MVNTLEKEFKIEEFIHKVRIVQAKLQQYYEDTQEDVDIPAHIKAQNAVVDLLDDREKFERLYQKAWKELQNRID